ncbi:MAG TPA: TadE/TadG family type IV pilus assembly protein [Chloroflexia bacterium]|nr:TadE/TadG family type IV pilus assembly protein [Chloroflexia bacterium]
MVEFAFVAMMFLLIIFGILEVGRLVFTINEISNAAREGSHYAALHPDQNANTLLDNVTQQVQSKLFIVDPTGVSVTVVCATCTGGALQCVATDTPPCDGSGQPVTVNVQYTWSTGVAFPGFPSGIPVNAGSTAVRDR